jgi:DNA invertase Pin-like site-specific DNA recombinase
MAQKGRSTRGRTHLAGERNPSARLNAATVLEIRDRLASGERADDLAEAFGVSRSTIFRIKNRTIWAST